MAASARGFLGWWLVPVSLLLPHPPTSLSSLSLLPRCSSSLPSPPPRAGSLAQASCARRLSVALRQAARPTAMELPRPRPVAGSALGPADMRGSSV